MHLFPSICTNSELFRSLVLLLTSLFAVLMLTSCGSDDMVLDKHVPANFVSANPPSGCSIAANASITVTFDNPPADVKVSAGVATTAGKSVTVAGPFTPGPLSLTITWTGGSQTLTYPLGGGPCQ